MQVIAFVLEAFFAEMDLESSDKSEEEDKVCSYLYLMLPGREVLVSFLMSLN